jgi:hypothetical protein
MSSGAWVRIPSPTAQHRWLIAVASLAIAGVFLWTPIGTVTRLVDRAVGPSPVISFGLPVLLPLIVGGIAYLISSERTQPLEVDAARSRLRLGRREWGFSEVTGARVELAGGDGDDTLVLRLTTTGGESCGILVSTRTGTRIDDAQRDALLALVDGSRIAPPRSKDDPHGRFAHIEFPGHLTREDAMALVDGSGTAEASAAAGQRGLGTGARNVRATGTPRRGPGSFRAQYVVAALVAAAGAFFAFVAVQDPSAVFGRGDVPVIGLALIMLPGGIAAVLITRRDSRRAAEQRAAAAAARAEAEADAEAERAGADAQPAPVRPADED